MNLKIATAVFLTLMLSACGTGQFGSSYQGYIDPYSDAGVIALGQDEEPIIIRTNDINADVRRYREHNYVVVGESAFNGLEESDGNAARKAFGGKAGSLTALGDRLPRFCAAGRPD